MDYKDYIKERLDDQIEWYSQKSGTAQKWYKRLSISSYIGAGLITILSLLVIEYAFIKYCISILGVAIGVIASIKNLYKYHDNWISYRYTSELLKQEKYMCILLTSTLIRI